MFGHHNCQFATNVPIADWGCGEREINYEEYMVVPLVVEGSSPRAPVT